MKKEIGLWIDHREPLSWSSQMVGRRSGICCQTTKTHKILWQFAFQNPARAKRGDLGGSADRKFGIL